MPAVTFGWAFSDAEATLRGLIALYGQEAQTHVAALVDFDNVVLGDVPDPARTSSLLDRIVSLALDRWPQAGRIDVSLYGGWLKDGVLTRRGSDLQSSVAATRFFPLRHPYRSGVLRGDVTLATRLASVPTIEWAHTLRERDGVPRFRFRDPGYPLACVHRSSDCPLKRMRNFSKSREAVCDVTACAVTNRQAFRVPEQKLVDVMMACDVIHWASLGRPTLVLSSDLDVLPAVAMAASMPTSDIALLRVERYAADLYQEDIRALGVRLEHWEGT